MSYLFVAPIVEGHGEVDAVPALLHRIKKHLAPQKDLRVNPPIRIKASAFLQRGHDFQRHIQLAAAKARQHDHSIVLVLLDCEDQSPCTVGPTLLDAASDLDPGVSFLVNLAYREYETWFLSAARSLRGIAGLPVDLDPPAQPERIRDAKGWLGSHMPDGYQETTHQLILTRKFSFSEAGQIRSFARLLRKLGPAFVLSPVR